MTEVRRTRAFPSPRDRDRWHVVITKGDVARDIRLPNNPRTAEAAEIEAQRLYELNGGTTVKHRIKWFGRLPKGDPEYPDGWVPRTPLMRARHWGWDVKCSCGQQTNTGGEIHERMRERVYWHHRGYDLSK